MAMHAIYKWFPDSLRGVPTAIIAELFGSGHFPQIEQAEEVSAAIAQFVRRECVQ